MDAETIARARARNSDLAARGYTPMEVANVVDAAIRWASESILVGQPWWWDGDLCLGCGADALSWEIVAHDDDCCALALDAALARLAGGEGE